MKDKGNKCCILFGALEKYLSNIKFMLNYCSNLVPFLNYAKMISILLAVAILGYLSVILESPIKINKTIIKNLMRLKGIINRKNTIFASIYICC